MGRRYQTQYGTPLHADEKDRHSCPFVGGGQLPASILSHYVFPRHLRRGHFVAFPTLVPISDFAAAARTSAKAPGAPRRGRPGDLHHHPNHHPNHHSNRERPGKCRPSQQPRHPQLPDPAQTQTLPEQPRLPF